MSKISELSDGGSLVSTDYLIAVRSGGNVKVRMDEINVDQVDLGDNEFIRLGNSQDLTLVHDASNSIINQAGIGDLLIQKAGSTKLTVNSSGIDVTGTVTADGLTVDDVVSIDTSTGNAFSSTGNLKIDIDSDNNQTDRTFQITSDGSSKTLFQAEEGGDISFYEDTGTTAKFFWDASAERLGLGTTSALADLHIVNSAAAQFLLEAGDSSTATMLFGDSADTNIGWIQYDNSDNNMNFRTNNTERMRIDSSGGIRAATGSRFLAASTGEATPDYSFTSDGSMGMYRVPGSLCFSTGGTERLRIDSNGQVDVGSNATASAGLSKQLLSLVNPSGTTGTAARLWMSGTNATSRGTYIEAEVQSTGNDHDLIFATSASGAAPSEAMRIDSSNNVGINATTIAANGLQIGNTSSTDTEQLFLYSNKAIFSINTDGATNAAGTTIAYSWANGGQGPLKFDNATSTVMTLDASGNLLVGKSATSFGTDGFQANADGQIWATNASASVTAFNRRTTPGAISVFYQDGAPVGSIGTQADDLNIGNADVALRFADDIDSIIPFSQTANSDRGGAIDLGYPSAATTFKDLYLSGGVDISYGAAPQTAFIDFTQTINDDAVFSFTPDKSFGVIYIYGRNVNYDEVFGIVSYRTVSSAFCTKQLDPSSVISVSTSVLTGTTGTDGQVTISAVQSDGKIYIENRRGVAISIGIHVTGQ